jgi:TonB-linked SusC/RagA family outer membrane protein
MKNFCTRCFLSKLKTDYKTLLIMKFTILLTLLTTLNVSAVLYSQDTKLSLAIKDKTLREVIQNIESQSNFRFFFSDDYLDLNKKVTVYAQNKGINEILPELLEQSKITYKVMDNNVVVIIPATAKQTNSINGIITDGSTGEPLIGVNVIVRGTTRGVVTDANGKFSLEAAPGETIVVSYVGYLSEEVVLGDQKTITVTLMPDVKRLDEVVVVGYGTMKKSDLTGAVASVKASDITGTKSSNAIEALQGKVAGLDMTQSSGQAGAGFNVLLRGARSLTASNDPIYIVDGVDYGSNVNINPNDIASMEVLKDASSTAIYGSKGANGVILITTKKGSPGKMLISFDTYYGYTTPLGKIKNGKRDFFLKEARDLYRSTSNNWGLTDDEIDLSTVSVLSNNEKVGYENGTNFDWVKAQMLDHGSQQNYHLTVSGGNDRTSYSVSLDDFVQNNYIPNDNLSRYSIKSNIDTKVTKFFEMGNSTMLTYSKNRRGNGITYSMNPLTTPYDANGKLVVLPDDRTPFTNPVIDLDPNNTINEVYNTALFSTFYGQVNLLKGLTFKSSFNLNLSFNRAGTYQRELLVDTTKNRVSAATLRNQQNYKYTWTNVLTFDRNFNKHHIQFTGGTETMYSRIERAYESGQNLALKDSWWYTLSSANQNTTITDPNTSTTDPNIAFPLVESSLVSFISRLHYGFDGKYLLTLTGRYDGASQLRKKWDFFPSASVAWRISQENFMKGISAISNLKLRLGYGVAGNQSVAPYASFGGIITQPLTYEFGSPEKYLPGYRTGRVENPELRWEKTATTNLGLDFGIFADRISGSVDIYKSKTSDLLQSRTLPPTSAVPYIVQNVGATENKGIEVTLRTVNIATKDLTWTTDFTFASNSEKITSLVGGVSQDIGNGWFVGEPVYVYYGKKKSGIYQLTDAEEAAKSGKAPGDIRFRDVDGNDTINDKDRMVLGSPRPKWTGGLNSMVTYKNFDFSIFVNVRFGQMINDVAAGYFSPDLRENAIEVNYWTPENPTNQYPKLNKDMTRSGYTDLTLMQYMDGSFAKIKDITLGYTLPKSLTKKVLISSLRIYVNAKNAFVFGPYFDKGRYDPEGTNAQGQTNVNYPNPKMFTVGANVTF